MPMSAEAVLEVTGTPEQKFMLMLVERLEAAEADVARLKRFCGLDKEVVPFTCDDAAAAVPAAPRGSNR